MRTKQKNNMSEEGHDLLDFVSSIPRRVISRGVAAPFYLYAELTLDLQMMRSHILTICQQPDPSKKFIAK